mgnify:CR=1 FL=1
MKYIYLTFFVSVFAMANEISRMESIVEDIEKLRSNYTKCMKELVLKTDVDNSANSELKKMQKLMEEYKVLLEEEKVKNTLLLSQKNEKLTLDEKSNKVKKNILETKLKDEKIKNESLSRNLKIKYEKIIKDKDNIIISLRNKIKITKKPIMVKKEICEDENPFPSLMMKENKEEKISAATLNLKVGTYRLNQESEIYDGINGNVLFLWEDKSSFTTTKVTQDWIKVTGYFVDKKWTKAEKNLWVKKVNATLR